MNPPRIAYVGPPDAVAAWLFRAIAQVAVFEAICAPDAEAAARKHQARWAFADLDALLREAQPEGIILAEDPARRPALIKQCLSGGIGVLVPGAPGPSAACKRIGTFAKLCGRVVLAAPAARYSPGILLARRLIDSGRVGVPVLATLQVTRRGLARQGPADRGCVPLDLAYEAVDLVHLLFGPVEQVFATAHDDDAAVATLRTAAGLPIAVVLHGSGPTDAVGVQLEVRGRDGTRLTLDTDGRLLCGNGSRMHAAHRPTLATADPAVELGHVGLIDDFVRYLRAGRGGPGLVGSVAPVVACAEALLASAAKGRLIAPRQHPDRDGRPAKASGKAEPVEQLF